MNLKGSSVIALSTSSWERLTNEIRKVIILTKGTKVFRIIISILLALTMIISAFFAVVFCLYFEIDAIGGIHNRD